MRKKCVCVKHLYSTTEFYRAHRPEDLRIWKGTDAGNSSFFLKCAASPNKYLNSLFWSVDGKFIEGNNGSRLEGFEDVYVEHGTTDQNGYETKISWDSQIKQPQPGLYKCHALYKHPNRQMVENAYHLAASYSKEINNLFY